MDISLEIDAVYQRASLLGQSAAQLDIQPELIAAATKELHFVLEELQASQEELRRQNQRLTEFYQTIEADYQHYKLLFELLPDSHLVTDQQGNIHQANQAAANLFNIPQEYLVNMPLMVLIHESDRVRFQTRLINLNQLHLQQMQNWIVSLNSQNGEPQSVAISINPIRGKDEQDNCLLWVLHKITSEHFFR